MTTTAIDRTCPLCGTGTGVPLSLLTKGRYRLHDCGRCRTHFYLDEQDGPPPPGEGEYWEAYKFSVYGDDAVRRAFAERYSAVLADARTVVSPIESVLDIGCGIGGFVAYAQDAGLRAIGSDASPEAVAAARERGLDCVVPDELDAHVPDGSVDALTMWDVVEHLVRPAEVLADVVRKVRPGGAVVFETPDGGFPVRAALLGLHRVSGGRVDLTGPMYYWEHKTYPTEQGLRLLLDRVGVDLVHVRRATSVREKMSRQFEANARKGSRKAAVLRRSWPVLETAFRAAGRGNKLLAVGRRREPAAD